jgi:hypothetical protein
MAARDEDAVGEAVGHRDLHARRRGGRRPRAALERLAAGAHSRAWARASSRRLARIDEDEAAEVEAVHRAPSFRGERALPSRSVFNALRARDSRMFTASSVPAVGRGDLDTTEPAQDLQQSGSR